jgi:glucose/mannose-6-phosphate isomerase
LLDDLKMIHERDSQDLLGAACRAWKNIGEENRETAAWLRDRLAGWEPMVPTSKNLAKQLALELIGKTVVIYGGEVLDEAAGVWKTSINSNAKQLAWKGELSDAEILGWTKQPVSKPYAVVELRSNLEPEMIRQRFADSQRLLSGLRPAPHVIEALGEDVSQQSLYCSTLGEVVSVYLALLNGLDPAKREVLSKLQKEHI